MFLSEFKIHCSKHANQPVSNFCSHSDCKIALCASCIGQHTQMHLRQNTEPIFTNIKQTQSQVLNKLDLGLDLVLQLIQRLDKIVEKIFNKEINLKQLMKNIRKQAAESLNLALNQLQQKMFNQMVTEGQKNNLHSISRIQNLLEKAKRQKTNYLQALEDMKKPDFAINIKRVTDSILEGGSPLLNDLKQQVINNEKYSTDLQFDRNLLKQNLSKAVDNIIKLNFTIPHNTSRKSTHSIKNSSSTSQLTINNLHPLKVYNSLMKPTQSNLNVPQSHLQNIYSSYNFNDKNTPIFANMTNLNPNLIQSSKQFVRNSIQSSQNIPRYSNIGYNNKFTVTLNNATKNA